MSVGQRRRVERRFATILAANVADYSRLVGADKAGTVARLKAHLRELIDPKIRQHGGRGIKSAETDGMLVEFVSVIDAVRCAIEIQRGMLDRELGIVEDRRIWLRIGVNFGEVIAEGGDIFGRAVETAAQLEVMAEPGGVWVSRTVRDQLHDPLPCAFADLGEPSAPNIARHERNSTRRNAAPRSAPPALADLLPSSAAGPLFANPAPRLSIVVLPFLNLSRDPEQQYLVDGVTEDLAVDLSRLPGIAVISRNTAFAYRDRPVDLAQIGRELNVRYVMEGSIRRSGNRVSANAQLTNAETGEGVWSDRFVCEADDLFALQDEVTGRIAVALNLQITGVEAARPMEKRDALDYILKGRATLNRGSTRQNLAKAIELFTKALVLDPGSGQAKALTSGALALRVLDQLSNAPAVDLERAWLLAGEAQFSSGNAALVNFIKGQILRAQRRYDAAIPQYEAALSLDRNAVAALAALGQCKFLSGAIDETIPAQERAIRLSPRDPHIANWYWRIGMVHMMKSRMDDAVLWIERAQHENPRLAGPHAWLASALALVGETKRAKRELERATRLGADGRYSSICRFRELERWSPKLNQMAETTFFAGLRKAGVPEN